LMKSETFLSRFNPSCCALCRSANSSGWAARIRVRANVAPLGELRKASEVRMAPHRVTHEAGKADSEAVNSPLDKSSIAVQYANRQRQKILSALTACRGRVGGADGAAARLGINRTTLLSRMKKFAIYAKQFS